MSLQKSFTLGGLTVGLICGVGALVYAYALAPSLPGPMEMVLQIAIVAIFGAVGAALGFAIGSVASLFIK